MEGFPRGGLRHPDWRGNLVQSYLDSKILSGILLAVSVGSIIYTVRQWRKHPLVDEAVDRELQEEKKDALTAMGGILLLFAFAIFLLILAIRAF